MPYDELRSLRIKILASAGAAFLVLVGITTVSVYKPWEKIQFGVSLPGFKATTRKPLRRYLFIGMAIALLAFVLLHIIEGGMHN